MKPSLFILITLFLSFTLDEQKCSAQINVKDTIINVSMVSLGFGYQTPQMDLSERFLDNIMVGGNYMFKFKNNWIITSELNFLWRDTIKPNNILDELFTSQGVVLNKDGISVKVQLYERGINSYIGFGRIFPLFGPNPNSGIMATAKIGFLQHKILVRTLGPDLFALTDEMMKGYDRLSNGISVGGFIGYLFFSNNRKINFFTGIDYLYTRTVNRRGYNYDEMKYDSEKRDDILIGIKFGWIVPIYRRIAREFYTN